MFLNAKENETDPQIQDQGKFIGYFFPFESESVLPAIVLYEPAMGVCLNISLKSRLMQRGYAL